jgi:high-affinity nickel permease
MKFKKGQSVGKLLSNIVAIILLGGTFVSFIVMYRIIKKGRSLRKGTQEHEEHTKKYEMLHKGLKESSNWVTAYWKLLVIGRWTVTNYILIVLKDYPQF